MPDLVKIAEVVVNTTKKLASDENVVEFLCGTYSDGTPRNLPDALNGEYLSPKQKKKNSKKKKKKKHNVKFKL